MTSKSKGHILTLMAHIQSLPEVYQENIMIEFQQDLASIWASKVIKLFPDLTKIFSL